MSSQRSLPVNKRILLLVALMLPAAAMAQANPCSVVVRSIMNQSTRSGAEAMCRAGREMALEGRTLRDVQFTVQGLVAGDDTYQQTGTPSPAVKLMGTMLIYGFKSQRGETK
ncbi:hypothetical protein [Enterobacter phage ST22]|nr:hypothetical protein [Enterobacter phage ST22]